MDAGKKMIVIITMRTRASNVVSLESEVLEVLRRVCARDLFAEASCRANEAVDALGLIVTLEASNAAEYVTLGVVGCADVCGAGLTSAVTAQARVAP